MAVSGSEWLMSVSLCALSVHIHSFSTCVNLSGEVCSHVLCIALTGPKYDYMQRLCTVYIHYISLL